MPLQKLNKKEADEALVGVIEELLNNACPLMEGIQDALAETECLNDDVDYHKDKGVKPLTWASAGSLKEAVKNIAYAAHSLGVIGEEEVAKITGEPF